MHATDVLVDAFGRVSSDVHRAVDGLDLDALTLRVDAGANPVAWLVWHLTRVMDDHVADLDGGGLDGQVWTTGGWADRFALPLDRGSIGYGHTSDQVAAVRAGADDLLGYHDAVQSFVVSYLGRIADDDLDAAARLLASHAHTLAETAGAAALAGLLAAQDRPRRCAVVVTGGNASADEILGLGKEDQEPDAAAARR